MILIFFADKSSTSVSHLVENELPLASVILPSTSTIDKRVRVSQSSVNEFQTQKQDLNEIVADDEHKKSTENYNNMFRENSERKKLDESSDVQDVSQNVYSNIPPTADAVPNILKNATADHVYSNIDEAKAVGKGGGYMSDNLDLD